MKHCRIVGSMPSSTSVSNSFEVSETLYIHISGLTPKNPYKSVVSPCDPRSHDPHLNLRLRVAASNHFACSGSLRRKQRSTKSQPTMSPIFCRSRSSLSPKKSLKLEILKNWVVNTLSKYNVWEN